MPAFNHSLLNLERPYQSSDDVDVMWSSASPLPRLTEAPAIAESTEFVTIITWASPVAILADLWETGSVAPELSSP